MIGGSYSNGILTLSKTNSEIDISLPIPNDFKLTSTSWSNLISITDNSTTVDIISVQVLRTFIIEYIYNNYAGSGGPDGCETVSQTVFKGTYYNEGRRDFLAYVRLGAVLSPTSFNLDNPQYNFISIDSDSLTPKVYVHSGDDTTRTSLTSITAEGKFYRIYM